MFILIPSPSSASFSHDFMAVPVIAANILPDISSFTAGASLNYIVRLSWTVTGASSLSIDNGVGAVTGLTYKDVTVGTDTMFTLTAVGSGGSIAKSVLAIPDGIPPVVSNVTPATGGNSFATIYDSTLGEPVIGALSATHIVTVNIATGASLSQPTVLSAGSGVAIATRVSDGLHVASLWDFGATCVPRYVVFEFPSTSNTDQVFIAQNLTSLLAAQTPSWSSCCDMYGQAVPGSTIVNLTGGLYAVRKPVPGYYDVFGVIDLGAGANPKYIAYNDVGSLAPRRGPATISGAGSCIGLGVASLFNSPLYLLRVIAVDAYRLQILYSVPVVESEATDLANYSLSGLTISRIAKITDAVYMVYTSKQTELVSYNLVVTGIHDLNGNPIN